MRVAVIGCLGSAGRRHAANLDRLGICRRIGLFDLVDGPHSQDVRSMVWWQWDAVVIATPWDQHLEWAHWAGVNGLAMYVEKPLGSLKQLSTWQEMVRATESQGLTTQVGYQLRFHPRYKAMRQLVPKPNGGIFTCDFDMGTWPGKSYGPAMLEASHEIDLALDCGLSAKHVTLNSWAEEYYRQWCICDDHAVADVQFWSAAELGDQMYVDAMAHFLECVREGKPTICPLSDGVRVLEALWSSQ